MHIFPVFTTINAILEAVEGNPNFSVNRNEREGYGTICYTFVDSSTFPGEETAPSTWKLLRECRGIKFDLKTGEILSRPWHKFFNYGEKLQETRQFLDTTQYATVAYEKLDGSMITIFNVKGHGWKVATKKGASEVASNCRSWLESSGKFTDYTSMQEEYPSLTFIYEWEDPNQPIVIQHSEPRLVLTGARTTVTGHYVSHDRLTEIAYPYRIPVVKRFAVTDLWKLRTDMFNGVYDGTEGFVVHCVDLSPFWHGATAHMFKMKTEWYLSRHGSVDALVTNRRLPLVKLILKEQVDDLLPLLPDSHRKTVERISDAIGMYVTRLVETVSEFVKENCGLSRKDYAFKVNLLCNRELSGMLFSAKDMTTVHDIYAVVLSALDKKISQEKDLVPYAKDWKLYE